MLTQAENLHRWLTQNEKALKHCEVSIAEGGVIWIRSAEYINVFSALDRAGRLFGYRAALRGRDFERPAQSYYVTMERVKQS